MSLLTTAQLTFCDLKDSYSIHMDTDCIGLACSNNGLVLESQTITINYRALMGSTRVDASCEAYDFPSGVTLIDSTPASEYKDGTIVLNINKDATLGNKQSSSIKIIFTVLNSEQFTFEKYITFVKYMVGASGEDAITFQIYSNQGFIFSEDMEQIELRVAAFKGADIITDATYTWSWLNNDSDTYTEIVSNSVDPFLIINKTDDHALANLKCTMTYNNRSYEDYIMLSNETVIYTSVVKFFDGNNIFSSNDLYIVAYVETYRNSDRSETIATTTYCSGVSAMSSDGEIYSSLTGEFFDGDQIYFICQNNDGLYEAVLGQYMSGVWKAVENNLQYTYVNTLYPNINSNILVISKDSINKSQNIDFMVYKDGVHVSSTSTNVIDSDDPIVSNDAPENPVYNQLWLDTSVSPYVLKIFTKVNEEEVSKWVDCAEQMGGATYTSKPSTYKAGDLWILADNERCGDFGPGSMLKSTSNSDTFSEHHWIDASSRLTETITNIRESFTWDERGIQIAKRVTASNGNITNPFYVHIDSTRMGFHSVTYKENGAQDRDVEVVHIGYNSATIQNATFEGSNGTTFDNDATFNKQINMNGIDKNGSSVGFVWKIETNGSLSLALSN